MELTAYPPPHSSSNDDDIRPETEINFTNNEKTKDVTNNEKTKDTKFIIQSVQSVNEKVTEYKNYFIRSGISLN